MEKKDSLELFSFLLDLEDEFGFGCLCKHCSGLCENHLHFLLLSSPILNTIKILHKNSRMNDSAWVFLHSSRVIIHSCHALKKKN